MTRTATVRLAGAVILAVLSLLLLVRPMPAHAAEGHNDFDWVTVRCTTDATTGTCWIDLAQKPRRAFSFYRVGGELVMDSSMSYRSHDKTPVAFGATGTRRITRGVSVDCTRFRSTSSCEVAFSARFERFRVVHLVDGLRTYEERWHE